MGINIVNSIEYQKHTNNNNKKMVLFDEQIAMKDFVNN